MSREHRPPTLAFVVLVVLVIAVIGVHRADAGAGGVVVAQAHPPFTLDEYASAVVTPDASGFSLEGPLSAGLHPWFADIDAAHGAGPTRSAVTDAGGGADAPARPPSRSGARVAPDGRPTAGTERRSHTTSTSRTTASAGQTTASGAQTTASAADSTARTSTTTATGIGRDGLTPSATSRAEDARLLAEANHLAATSLRDSSEPQGPGPQGRDRRVLLRAAH
jgi:hypothetical protein